LYWDGRIITRASDIRAGLRKLDFPVALLHAEDCELVSDAPLGKTTAGALGAAPGVGGVGAVTLLPRARRKAMIAIPIALDTTVRIKRLFTSTPSYKTTGQDFTKKCKEINLSPTHSK